MLVMVLGVGVWCGLRGRTQEDYREQLKKRRKINCSRVERVLRVLLKAVQKVHLLWEFT